MSTTMIAAASTISQGTSSSSPSSSAGDVEGRGGSTSPLLPPEAARPVSPTTPGDASTMPTKQPGASRHTKRRGCTFDTVLVITEIPSHRTYTPEERRSTWYRPEDYRRFKLTGRACIDRFRMVFGSSNNLDDDDEEEEEEVWEAEEATRAYSQQHHHDGSPKPPIRLPTPTKKGPTTPLLWNPRRTMPSTSRRNGDTRNSLAVPSGNQSTTTPRDGCPKQPFRLPTPTKESPASEVASFFPGRSLPPIPSMPSRVTVTPRTEASSPASATKDSSLLELFQKVQEHRNQRLREDTSPKPFARSASPDTHESCSPNHPGRDRYSIPDENEDGDEEEATSPAAGQPPTPEGNPPRSHPKFSPLRELFRATQTTLDDPATASTPSPLAPWGKKLQAPQPNASPPHRFLMGRRYPLQQLPRALLAMREAVSSTESSSSSPPIPDSPTAVRSQLPTSRPRPTNVIDSVVGSALSIIRGSEVQDRR